MQGILLKRPKLADMVAVGFVGVLVATSVALNIVALTVDRTPTAAAHYLNNVITPPQPEYCPGATLDFQAAWVVTEAPSILRAVETWYSLDNRYTVVRDHDYDISIVTDLGTSAHEYSRIVPPLAPGRYEYRRALEQSFSEASAFVVPFTVPANCP